MTHNIIFDNVIDIETDIKTAGGEMESKIGLVLHPVRLRILRELAAGDKTARRLQSHIGDVPLSSIYRHLPLLVEGGLIAVESEHFVNGIVEKSYRLARAPDISVEEINAWTTKEHIVHFTTFIASQIQDFANYIESSKQVNYAEDLTGYREISFYADKKEFAEAIAKINQALLPLLTNEVSPDKVLHKLVTITHPVAIKEPTNV